MLSRGEGHWGSWLCLSESSSCFLFGKLGYVSRIVVPVQLRNSTRVMKPWRSHRRVPESEWTLESRDSMKHMITADLLMRWSIMRLRWLITGSTSVPTSISIPLLIIVGWRKNSQWRLFRLRRTRICWRMFLIRI